jgi:hypothetical protein
MAPSPFVAAGDHCRTIAMRPAVPARLRLEPLESRTVPAVVTWDGGPAGTGTNWLDPVNWVGDQLPGPNDDAIIASTGAEITVGGSAGVHSVVVGLPRTVRLTAGTLAVGAAPSKFYDLVLDGGTLDAADGATLTASPFGPSYMEGPGTFTNPAGRTLTLQGVVLTAPVVNQGTLVAAGDNQILNALTTGATSVIRLPGLSAPSALSVFRSFTNNGLIELAPGSAAPSDTLSVGGTNVLTNASGGTISAPGGVGGSRAIAAAVNNQGTLTVGAGTTLAVGSFTNLADTLAGGTFYLAGRVNVTVAPRLVSTNAATVILVGSTAGFFTDNGSVNLLSTLGANATGGSLTLTNGAVFTALSPFANAGQVTVESGSAANTPATLNYAATVLDFSTQYTGVNWSAAQTLGPPNTTVYGDQPTAWAAAAANMTPAVQTLTFGFSDPVVATGAVIRETLGNGFVTQIDALDAGDVFHTVWSGTDPSQPGSVVDFVPTWEPTPYLVKGLRISVDTSHSAGYEEFDSVRLLGGGAVHGYNQAGGTTTVNGFAAVSAANLAGGSLTGTGSVTGPVTATGTQIRPGTPAGRLTVTGDFALPAGGSLVAEIYGPDAVTQYDQLMVNGTVTLGGSLAATVTYPSAVGDSYTLIDNDGTDAVVGTFSGLAEGAVVALGGQPYRISYVGGTGNDVVLTRVPLAHVATVAVNDGVVQSSRVTEVTVTFTTRVTLPDNPAQAFQVVRTGPGGPTSTVGLSVDLSSSTPTRTVAKLTFSGALTAVGSLIDGTYVLTVFGAQVAGPGGLALDGDNNGVAGGNFYYGTNPAIERLYRLFGDADGNRRVDAADLNLFRAAFGAVTTDPTFDINGDGVINALDLAALLANFGASL